MQTVEVLRQMIVEEFEVEPAALQADTDLETLGIDSLSIIEFMFKIEDRFHVVMPDRRAEQLQAADGAVPAKRVWTLRVLAEDLDALVAAQRTSAPAASPAP